ncbi:MAG: formate dehydrogenase family accessory protein FdhD [Bradyrhizobium sp.]|nr:formate dehydrogenase family accessory protein FdhD [Bradyrhizobium sp.]
MQPLRHLTASPFVSVPVNATSEGQVTSQLVCVAEETPVGFRYSGFAHAVMMATPEDLEDFAVGFSLSEGATRTSGPLPDISIHRGDEGITVDITLCGEDLHRYLAGRRVRQLRGHTSCGLCGVEDLSDIARPGVRVRTAPSLDTSIICNALTALRQWQPLSRQTRGAHASAWANLEGDLQMVREDVGRHNSLDKLIGARLRNRSASDGFCAITSRCSFEMVQKAVAAGFPTLVSVGAPTAHAIRLAIRAGLTLYSLSRDGEPLLFTSPAFSERDTWPELAS